MIFLSNTLTGKKEALETINPGHIRMYVCGVTPYDAAHLGHARSAVVFDLIVRFLTFKGYTVNYCRNYTDIDDKLLHKASIVYGDRLRYQEIAEQYIKNYEQEVAQLNCLKPTMEPRVTQHIPEIIKLIETLIAQGHAYESQGDVYFAVHSFSSYGKLSKQNVDELRSGARIERNELKKDSLDFALWKKEPEGTFFKSPWGFGRPGWHIECSALALTYLGSELDIHGGGLDLIFPHHENEIAQSESANKCPLARYWLHNGLIMVNHEKMSKSIGNFKTIAHVLEEYDPMLIRYYLLTHHYRAPIDFTHENLVGVAKGYHRLCALFVPVGFSKDLLLSKEQVTSEVLQKMIAMLSDDFNTVGMLGVLFEHAQEIAKDNVQLTQIKQFIYNVWGLSFEPIVEQVIVSPEIQRLLNLRDEARKAKDWALSDTLRTQLEDLGYKVQDKKL